MNKRLIPIDMIRCLACILVVLNHSCMPGITNQWIDISVAFISIPCVPLFFMVSGYLLLPVNDSLLVFLKKRMSHILWPLLSFTTFYLLYGFFTEHSSPAVLLKKLLSVPFSPQGHGVLWFMYTLIGLYIIAPVVTPWLEKCTKRELQIVLGLWGISLCYPYLISYFHLDTSVTGILYYYSGYVGYFVLGYYVKRYQPTLSYAAFNGIYFGIILIAIVSKILVIEVVYHSFTSYLSLLVAIMTLSIFLITYKITPPNLYYNQDGGIIESVISNFSRCSFGIYLMHIFIMRQLIWKIDFLNSYGGYFQVISSLLLTLLASWILTNIISYAPFGKYIVGFNRKNKKCK